MTNISLPADDAFARALERGLPGDKLMFQDGPNLITMILRKATPNAMTPNGTMTWNKQFEVESVQPWPGDMVSVFVPGHDARIQRDLAEVTGPYGQKTFVLADFSGGMP